MVTLFAVLNGDVVRDTFQALEADHLVTGQIFMYTFVSLFIFCCLNVTIALVEEAFFFTAERTAAIEGRKADLEQLHAQLHAQGIGASSPTGSGFRSSTGSSERPLGQNNSGGGGSGSSSSSSGSLADVKQPAPGSAAGVVASLPSPSPSPSRHSSDDPAARSGLGAHHLRHQGRRVVLVPALDSQALEMGLPADGAAVGAADAPVRSGEAAAARKSTPRGADSIARLLSAKDVDDQLRLTRHKARQAANARQRNVSFSDTS